MLASVFMTVRGRRLSTQWYNDAYLYVKYIPILRSSSFVILFVPYLISKNPSLLCAMRFPRHKSIPERKKCNIGYKITFCRHKHTQQQTHVNPKSGICNPFYVDIQCVCLFIMNFVLEMVLICMEKYMLFKFGPQFFPLFFSIQHFVSYFLFFICKWTVSKQFVKIKSTEWNDMNEDDNDDGTIRKVKEQIF